jgi:hypothetical protein
MMRCKDVRGLLDWFADGELDPEQQEAVRAHLESCQACSEHLGLIHAGIRLAQSLPQEEPPAGLRPAVISRTVGRSKMPAQAGWARWPARAAVGLSLAAAAVVFAFVVPGLRTPGPAATAPAQLVDKAAAPMLGIDHAAKSHEVASDATPSAAPARDKTVRVSSARGTGSRPAGAPGAASEKAAQPDSPGTEPVDVLEETVWPGWGGDRSPSDGLLGPEVPTTAGPEAEAPMGEAARVAMERSIETDLAKGSSDQDTIDAILSSRLDTKELTEDLIRAINERLARAEPLRPVRKVRLEQGQRGGLEVPLVHGNFR